MRKARHRRRSRAVKVLSSTAPAAMVAGAILAGPSAHAQVTHIVMDTSASTATDTTMALVDKATVAKAQEKAVWAASDWVTVQEGQSLSVIAGHSCDNQSDWTGLYEGNKKTIGPNPNLVFAGQQLVLDCREEAVSLPQPVYNAPESDNPAPEFQPVSYQTVDAGSYGGGFQSCVIERESGGNSQVMNSSGHYGLYQFDIGTWEEGGGNPGDFGHASVAEQNQVFQNVYAQRGTEPWAAYDGC